MLYPYGRSESTIHVVLLATLQGRDIAQPPRSWLEFSCLWLPHSGTVGLSPASLAHPLLLLCFSFPLPDRRILQPSNAQEKVESALHTLFVDLGHSDLEESRFRGLFAVPSQASNVFTIILHNTEEQDQEETDTAA